MVLKMKCLKRIFLTVPVLIFGLIAGVAADGDISAAQWKAITQMPGLPSAQAMEVPSIYVFFDPNCPATAKLFRVNAAGKSFADTPAIWIPVYYMKADSLGKATAILREKQFLAIKSNFALYDAQNKSGAVTPVTPNFDERQEMDKAKQIWIGLTKIPATPMIVYKDRSGAAHVHLGYNPPEELERIVSEAPISRIQDYK